MATMTTKSLKILFIPLEFVDQTSPCVVLAQKLVDHGHTIIFMVDESRQVMLKQFGFKIIINKQPNKEFDLGDNSESDTYYQFFALLKPKLFWLYDAGKFLYMLALQYYQLYQSVLYKNEQLKTIIETEKPDIFVIDGSIAYMSVVESKKPWVWLFNGNPLVISNDYEQPPPYSGFSPGKSNFQWRICRTLYEICFNWTKIVANILLEFVRIDVRFIIDGSTYLNVYGFPKELEYVPEQSNKFKHKWFRVDSFVTIEDDALKKPENITQLPIQIYSKKLIYVSMGSLCTANVEYMKTLVKILSKSPHLFIVSKGYYHKEFDLADNMCGENVVPQDKIIPIVDLVISDGANSIITQTFSFGKPMIVFPFWLGQLDSSQRIQDTGYGIRLNPWLFKEADLLNAIEYLLDNFSLKERLNVASNRILNENRLEKAAELIESFDRHA